MYVMCMKRFLFTSYILVTRIALLKCFKFLKDMIVVISQKSKSSMATLILYVITEIANIWLKAVKAILIRASELVSLFRWLFLDKAESRKGSCTSICGAERQDQFHCFYTQLWVFMK